MKLKQARIVAVIAVLSLRLVACGGNPNGPSEGVTLDGTVVGGTFGAASVRGASSAAVLTVVVDGHPEMTTTIGADGSFTLRGLPEGSFTLIFLSDGAEIGRLTFAEVRPNQALTVTVSVAGGVVTLLEERRNGMGHGDFEIEGRVDQVLVLNPVGDSKFLIDGRTVIARPGQTSIREGNRARQVAEVLPNQQVHVKGVWLPPGPGGTQEALAWEIKLQGPAVGPSPSPGQTCMINGGRQGEGIQLEGRVANGTVPSFFMTVNGNRASGLVNILGTNVTCTGPRTTPAECLARLVPQARIHVSGTLTVCSLTAASVTASEIKIQN